MDLNSMKITFIYSMILHSVFQWFSQYCLFIHDVHLNDPPWHSSSLKNLKNRINKANKLKNFIFANLMYFRSIKHECQVQSRKSFQKYFDTTRNDIKSNPKKSWFYVTSRKSTTGYSSTISYLGKKLISRIIFAICLLSILNPSICLVIRAPQWMNGITPFIA